MSERIRILSLFSGCGGLDIPFEKRNCEIVGAFDNDAAAIRCLKNNLNCHASILDVTSDQFEEQLREIGQVDIVLGGFPCQGFSKSGPKNANDPRNKLYRAMLRAIEITEPKLFLAENVDGMAQNFNGRFVEQITADFGAAGYSVTSKILNAINFGVPQFRRRIFFVGTHTYINASFVWPEPTHYGGSRNGEFKTSWDVDNQPNLFQPKSLLKPVTIGDAISDLLNEDSSLPDHDYDESYSDKDRHIMAHIGEGQKLCNVRFSDTSVYTWNIPEAHGKTTNREREILITIGKNRRKKQYGTIPNGNPLEPSVISKLSGIELSVEELDELVRKKYLKKIDGKFDLKGAMFCSGLYKRPRWDAPAPTILTVYSP